MESGMEIGTGWVEGEIRDCNRGRRWWCGEGGRTSVGRCKGWAGCEGGAGGAGEEFAG